MLLSNAEIARRFTEIARLLQLDGADRFRVRAYERAADAISAASPALAELDPAQLEAVDGIGASTAAKIVQLRETGSIDLLTDLRERVPPGLLQLVRVPGLGPKTAVALHDRLGIDSIEGLRAAIDAHQIRTVPGLGAKAEENLRRSLERMGTKDDHRTPLADVVEVVDAFVERLRRLPVAQRVEHAGSLRRARDTVGDVDVLVSSDDPDPVMAAVRDDPTVERVLASGDTKTSVLVARGLQVDVRVVAPDSWGAALQYFTGSVAHNVRVRERAVRRGLLVNEYGVFARTDDGAAGQRVAGTTEEDVYGALGMAWVPPPMREDTGEVALAAQRALPAVVTAGDIRGDLHGHSDWSGDGRASLDDMLAAAAARGWAYWAVTDHADGLPMNGLSVEQFRERRRAIADLGDRHGVRVLDGVELNIGIDGSLDYDDDVLAEFDVCVASVHTLMTRGRSEQTERVVRAMRHPSVDVIGHLTGRKVGVRPPLELDIDRILEVAVETGTALEVNASPRRLDLSGEHVRRAVDAGVRLTISNDAHTVGDLDNLQWGVATAQRGWATAADVLNCLELDDLLAVLADGRARRRRSRT